MSSLNADISTTLDNDAFRSLKAPAKGLLDELYSHVGGIASSKRTERVKIWAEVESEQGRDVVRLATWNVEELYGHAEAPQLPFMNALSSIANSTKQLQDLEKGETEYALQ